LSTSICWHLGAYQTQTRANGEAQDDQELDP
jgi:hypothetical protein